MVNSQSTFSFEEVQIINSTIDGLYSSLSGNPEFTSFTNDFIDELKKQIYFDKGNFMFFKYDREERNYEVTSFIQTGWNHDDLEKYINTYVHIDDILPILVQRSEIAFINGDIFPSEERRRTKYYQEFVVPSAITNSLDANFLLNEDFDVYAILGLFRNPGQINFSKKDLEIIKTYQTHLGKVISSHMESSGLSSSGDFFNLFESFDSLGICILDSNLHVKSYNSAYKKFVTILDDTQPSSNDLYKKIAAACSKLRDSDSIDRVGPVEIYFNKISYMVEIVHDNRKTPPENERFVCIIYSPSDFFIHRLTALQKEYDLSKREFEVLYAQLKNGLTIADISKKIFISESTVKKHLSSAYKKMKVKNQKQLLNLLRIT